MMNRKWIASLLVLMLLLAIGIAGAQAASDKRINESASISFGNKVTVTLEYKPGKGGSGSVASSKVYMGQDVTIKDASGLKAPTGKKFAGWANTETGTPSFFPNTKATISANTTLYAIWSDAVEEVTVTLKNGTATKTEKAIVGQQYTLPTLAQLGWEAKNGFEGWDDGSSTTIKAGQTVTIESGKAYTFTVKEGTTTEFTAVITWDDADNLQESRPLASDLQKTILLKGGASDLTPTDILNADSNSWKVVWEGVASTDVANSYIYIPKVAGYEIAITSNTAATYRRSVGSVSITKWITNKKWDKDGNLIKFKAGQTVKFRIDIHNNGNTRVERVNVWEDLRNAKFKSGSGYKLDDGCAYIGGMNPGDTVSVYATYRVTSSDARKEKVANVAGVDFLRADGSWGSDWDAVRIPIKKGSTTSSGTSSATPVPTATPVPAAAEEIVSKLIKDITTNQIAYPTGKVEIVGASEILTPEEYAIFNTLNSQEQVLTVLNTVGFETLVPYDIQRYRLSVSDTAKNLMSSVLTRKAAMNEVDKAETQAKESVYFPRQQVIVNGAQQNYFETSLKFTNNGKERIDRYTFRQETNGEWVFVRLVTAQ